MALRNNFDIPAVAAVVGVGIEQVVVVVVGLVVVWWWFGVEIVLFVVDFGVVVKIATELFVVEAAPALVLRLW